MSSDSQPAKAAAPFPSPTATWHDNTYASLSATRPELSAKGKTVVITGGGTGIGAETARQFAAAGAARIALFGRREQPLLDTKAALHESFPDVDVYTHSADVADKAQLDAAFDGFLKAAHSPKVDVVISGAAKIGPMESAQDVDGEAFIEAVNVNLLGALYTAKNFLRYAAPGAVAVNISSSAAHLNFGPGFASYNCSKMSAFRLWDSVAFANPELFVYHIQPGVVDTDMNKSAGGVKAIGFEDHVSLPATFSLWLASPEARFLNRKFLWANWDVDELKAKADEIKKGGLLDVTLVGWPFAANDWSASWSM